MKISTTLLKQLRIEMNEALIAIAQKHGLDSITVGNASYSSDEANFKVKVKAKLDEQTAINKVSFEFMLVGLDASYFNKIFTISGDQYQIVGVNLKARKAPISIKRLRDGKGFKCATSYVLNK